VAARVDGARPQQLRPPTRTRNGGAAISWAAPPPIKLRPAPPRPNYPSPSGTA
jgi:hypothetical protein